MVPPTEEPNVDGEKDRMMVNIMSNNKRFCSPERNVDHRNAVLDEVRRVSLGKYQPLAQFQPKPRRLIVRSHASCIALPKVIGSSSVGYFCGFASCPLA